MACEKKESLMRNLDMWCNFVYEQPMVPNPARAKEAIGYMNKALQCYQWLSLFFQLSETPERIRNSYVMYSHTCKWKLRCENCKTLFDYKHH